MILVTGATGHVGTWLVDALSAAGQQVRAGSRRVSGDGRDGVERVGLDLLDPASVRSSLAGVDRVFLLWPLMTAAGAEPVVDAIRDAGVRGVVLLSSTAVQDTDDGPVGIFHADLERLLAASGVPWTSLRGGGFATNTLGWAQQIRDTGVVRWPFGKAARSLIHERDIADVAVRALLDDGHAGAVHVLTGPATITQEEQVATIGRALGRDLRWEDQPEDVARAQLTAEWGDPAYVDGALAYWKSLEAEPEVVTTAVRDVTGHDARTFEQWASDHVADFR